MDDPRFRLLRRALEGRPGVQLERRADEPEAAVVLLLRAADVLELLLIKRAEREFDPWSGHIALPGGRRGRSDADLVATALRETEEEIGVPLARVGQVLGELDDVAPRHPLLPPIVIAPFVVAVPSDTVARPDRREVDDVVWVPLPALREPGAVSEILIELEEGSRSFPSLRVGEYFVWGLTHRIILQFLQIAEVAGV